MEQRGGMCAVLSHVHSYDRSTHILATGAGQELCFRVKQGMVAGIRIPDLDPGHSYGGNPYRSKPAPGCRSA